jgi:hypothetical protein
MKKTILSLICFAFAAMMMAQTTTNWTISVANQGTAGGYIVDKQLKSTDKVGYSEHYPAQGYMPAWYIRFPKGNYTVKSQNNGLIDVHQVDKNQDIVTNQPAKSFIFRAPAAGWYRFVLRNGQPGQSLYDFNISSTDVKGANAVYLAAWRSVPSLHLNGFESTNAKLPQGNVYNWIYNEVQIPEDADFQGTYVEAFGFHNGYIGIQNNGRMADGKTNHTVIFSSWDNGDTDSNPTLAGYKRSGVIAIDSTLKNTVAERFSGEGTGVHVLLNGDYWKPGHWVRFLVNVQPEQIQLKDGSNYENTVISAWYNVRGLDDKWHYISSQRMAGQVNYFGSGFNAFLEEFTRGNTSQGHMPHKAYYRRIFTRSMQGGEWFNRNIFWFGHTDGGNAKGARNDRYQTKVNYDGEDAAYMQSGGYIEPKAGEAITLKYVEPGDFLPSDSVLAQLQVQYVAKALHTQEVQRMNTRMNDTYEEIPQKEWQLKGKSSEETVGEGSNGRAALVLDGNNQTFWHTEWQSGSNKRFPHYLEFVHTGATTLNRIVLQNDAKHSGNRYRARKVVVQVVDSKGKTTTQGTYTLGNGDQQEIVLSSTLELSAQQRLRLRFTEGYDSNEGMMAVAEIRFEKKNLERLRELFLAEYNSAGQWNHYTKTDVEKYLGEVKSHLATATEAEIQSALLMLSQKGKVIKYLPITNLAALNAERCYVLTNAEVSGVLVQPEGAAAPTLRNVDAKRATNTLDTYAQTMSVADSAANWLLVADERSGSATQYVVYNLKSGMFLQPAKGDVAATMGDKPAKFRLIQQGSNFKLMSVAGGTYPLVAHPEAAEGKELTGRGTKGAVWSIYENLYYQPNFRLVNAVRAYFKTGKFEKPVIPTGIAALRSTGASGENGQNADEARFDLSGRQLTTLHDGEIVVTSHGKAVYTR